MNPQTYDDLKAEIIKRLGNRQDISTRVDQWMTDAMTELTQAPKASFRELDALYEFVAQPNVFRLELPGDFWFILSLRTPERRLDQVHWQVLDQVYRTLGQPARFARYQNHIELDPMPDREYPMSMRYRRRLPNMIPGTPIPIEREWHEILITITVSKGLEALQRFEEASMEKQVIEATMATRMDNPMLEDDGFETTVGVRFR
jgi:hypothetical protein